MTRLHAIEERMLRGLGTWPVLGLSVVMVVLAAQQFASGADPLDVAAALTAAAALSACFAGTRIESRPLQRIGIALFVAWFALTITIWLS